MPETTTPPPPPESEIPEAVAREPSPRSLQFVWIIPILAAVPPRLLATSIGSYIWPEASACDFSFAIAAWACGVVTSPLTTTTAGLASPGNAFWMRL